MINYKDKKLMIAAVLLAVFLIVYFGFDLGSRKDALTLILDFGSGDKKTFYNYNQEEKSAWSVLQQAAAISGIDLQAGPGFIPKKIDGKANGQENKNWNLYVNGTRQTISPIEIKVRIPDEVAYKFE